MRSTEENRLKISVAGQPHLKKNPEGFNVSSPGLKPGVHEFAL